MTLPVWACRGTFDVSLAINTPILESPTTRFLDSSPLLLQRARCRTWACHPDHNSKSPREHTGEMVSVHAAGDVIESTGRHPYWVVRGEDLDSRPLTGELGEDNQPQPHPGRWVEARHLRVGDRLWTNSAGEVPIEDLLTCEATTVVYNFHVTECRSYTVGQSQVLVHNTSARDKLEEYAEQCCEVDPKPTVVARLILAGGREFLGKSSLVKVHPVVADVYDELSKNARSVYHKKCAETDAISKALFTIQDETGVEITTVQQAKAILSGSTIQTALRKNLEPEPPCNSCAWPLIVFDITYSRAY